MRIMAYVFVCGRIQPNVKKQCNPSKHKILSNRATAYRTALSHTHVHLGKKNSVLDPEGGTMNTHHNPPPCAQYPTTRSIAMHVPKEHYYTPE